MGLPGDPKIVQKGWVALTKHLPGTNLGPFWAPNSFFLRFWLSFWVPLGLIWGPSGLNFVKIQTAIYVCFVQQISLFLDFQKNEVRNSKLFWSPVSPEVRSQVVKSEKILKNRDFRRILEKNAKQTREKKKL